MIVTVVDMIRLLSSRRCISSNRPQQLFSLLSRSSLFTSESVPSQFVSFSTYKPVMSESTFYSLKAELPSGKIYDFADLKGKTVLIVNTASKWYVLLDSNEGGLVY